MEAKLTVCIPVLNNPEGCQELLNDFYRLHNPEEFRIIVIDQTLDGIKFRPETPVHLHIRPYKNLGFAKAMNTAIKLVQTPYMLLANDDVRLLNKSWLEDSLNCLNRPGVLAVNPFPATRTWDRFGNVIWYWNDFMPNGERDNRFDFIKDKPFEEYTDEDYAKLKQILGTGDGPGTATFFTLCKTELRDLVGFYDESYWNNGEDYDLNRRIYLTCSKCNKRKYEHMPQEGHAFEPYHIFTCKHAYIHHQCGVSKNKAAALPAGESSYSLVEKAKNIFNTKWGNADVKDPDIYGAKGAIIPNSKWFNEIPL